MWNSSRTANEPLMYVWYLIDYHFWGFWRYATIVTHKALLAFLCNYYFYPVFARNIKTFFSTPRKFVCFKTAATSIKFSIWKKPWKLRLGGVSCLLHSVLGSASKLSLRNTAPEVFECPCFKTTWHFAKYHRCPPTQTDSSSIARKRGMLLHIKSEELAKLFQFY